MNTILLLIILIPVIEIYLFIKIGSQIGAITTILLIFSTAIIGVYYAKYEGLNILKSGFKQLSKNINQNISKLDKLILQLSTSNFDNSFEIDHIFPTKRLKISKKLDSYLNLNHTGNLCYISKRNNQKKSNKLPSEYFQYLTVKEEFELLQETEKQTFSNRLHFNLYNDEIKSIEDFNTFLRCRSLIIRELIVENMEAI